MKQTRPLRLMHAFAGLTSLLISEATQAKNQGQDHNQCTAQLLTFAMDEIGRTETGHVFAAAAKVLPTVDIASVGSELYRTPLEIFVHQLATIAVNDTMNFVFGVEDMTLEEPELRSDPIYQVRTKRERTANTAISVDAKAISDELRDEMSGKNVQAGGADNDCGDACKI